MKIVARFVFVVLFAALGMHLSAQTISDVYFQQEDNNVVVYYTLSDKAASIRLEVSLANGSYRTLYKVSGDVGSRIEPGHHKIVWRALEEWQEGDFDVRFRVSAGRAGMLRRTFFSLDAAYSVAPQFAMGATVGFVKHVGLYAFGLTNFSFHSSEGTVNADGTLAASGELPFYDDPVETATSFYAIGGGLSVRVADPVWINVGAGYGSRGYYYLDEGGASYRLAECTQPYNTAGVVVDASLSITFGKVLLSVGADVLGINLDKKMGLAKLGVGLTL